MKKEYDVPRLHVLCFQYDTAISVSVFNYDGVTPDVDNPDDVIPRW